VEVAADGCGPPLAGALYEGCLLQVFESQFQLLDLPLQFLRLPPEADLNGERPATGAYRAALMLNS
jgi:hypothetical protein